MEESVTYQAIVEKGKAGEAREILLQVGTRFLGKPVSRDLAKLNKIDDKKKLEDLILRATVASNWSESQSKQLRVTSLAARIDSNAGLEGIRDLSRDTIQSPVLRGCSGS